MTPSDETRQNITLGLPAAPTAATATAVNGAMPSLLTLTPTTRIIYPASEVQ
jgi:hypothetical protein